MKINEMNYYYVSCLVYYTDPTDGQSDIEVYNSVVLAKTKASAENKAKKEALREFNEDLNDGFKNVRAEIDECYETSEDARS